MIEVRVFDRFGCAVGVVKEEAKPDIRPSHQPVGSVHSMFMLIPSMKAGPTSTPFRQPSSNKTLTHLYANSSMLIPPKLPVC